MSKRKPPDYERLLQKKLREAYKGAADYLRVNVPEDVTIGYVASADLEEMAETLAEHAAEIEFLRRKLSNLQHFTK